jgi:hypothetical protein
VVRTVPLLAPCRLGCSRFVQGRDAEPGWWTLKLTALRRPFIRFPSPEATSVFQKVTEVIEVTGNHLDK